MTTDGAGDEAGDGRGDHSRVSVVRSDVIGGVCGAFGWSTAEHLPGAACALCVIVRWHWVVGVILCVIFIGLCAMFCVIMRRVVGGILHVIFVGLHVIFDQGAVLEHIGERVCCVLCHGAAVAIAGRFIGVGLPAVVQTSTAFRGYPSSLLQFIELLAREPHAGSALWVVSAVGHLRAHPHWVRVVRSLFPSAGAVLDCGHDAFCPVCHRSELSGQSIFGVAPHVVLRCTLRGCRSRR